MHEAIICLSKNYKSVEDKNILLCVIYEKTRIFWQSKRVSQNKTSEKFVSLFLLDKIVSNEQISLAENNEIISKDGKVAQTLNSLFSKTKHFGNL